MDHVDYLYEFDHVEPTSVPTLRRHPRPFGRPIADAWIAEHGDPCNVMGTHAGVRADRPVAVISDVHANLHALTATLADIDARGIDTIWCLGDTVGYGAHPVECLRLVRDRCSLVLAGNHDLAVVADEPLDQFGAHAQPGIRHALRELSAADDGDELTMWLATRLAEVTDARRSDGYGLMHESMLGHHQVDALRHQRIVASHACPSPYDAVWNYLGIDVDALDLTTALGSLPLILVGHTHEQLVDAGVCNPGSVGQPRDGDPRAAWAELPSLEAPGYGFLDVVLHRAAYDIEGAQRAIHAAQLPAMTASRLAMGW